MSDQKFFICSHCKNLVGMIFSSGAPITCCGDVMQEIKANSTEAALEKHVPVITTEGNKVSVQVGSALHPMTEEHYIQWIYLETEHGGQRKALKPGSAPEAVFYLEDDKPLAAFAYCNLHGLWKSEI
jgi:desulfoferrodoxin ferrous iron-binding domain